jgi:hypothetical protein
MICAPSPGRQFLAGLGLPLDAAERLRVALEIKTCSRSSYRGVIPLPDAKENAVIAVMVGEPAGFRNPDAIAVERHNFLESIGVTGDRVAAPTEMVPEDAADSPALASIGSSSPPRPSVVLCADTRQLRGDWLGAAAGPAGGDEQGLPKKLLGSSVPVGGAAIADSCPAYSVRPWVGVALLARVVDCP